ncbi:HNH endonuclease, partial [Cronobacter sakazakii]|nr:HNH endonuclease [Cronobacter sakazakii]
KKLADDDVTFSGYAVKGRTGIDGLGLNQFSRRYIYHLLARLTEATEIGAGRTETFDRLVDRTLKNPFDIEHIWADDYEIVKDQFSTEQEFQDWRNHVASLLLLPADVNRSLQDKPFPLKRVHYAKQNFFAASLDSSVYEHQPQFQQFSTKYELSFK